MKGKNREHVLRAKDSRIEIPPFVIRTWFIIPFPINPVVANMMRRIGGSHKEAKVILVNMSNSLRTKSNSYGTPRLLGINDYIIQQAHQLIRTNDTTQRKVQRVAILWRKRHLKRANDEDLITMEVPVKRVDVYDWKERRIYTFEASTILRCMTKRLLYASGMFANPLHPVNPYTNVNFSIGQMHSIIEQLKGHGMTHWTLESLLNTSYNWTEFVLLNDLALQMEAINHSFADSANLEFQATLYDFIDAECYIHKVEIDEGLYKWAVKDALDSEYMTQWRRLCYEYYKVQIIYKEVPVKQKMAGDRISLMAKPLVLNTRELYNIRRGMTKAGGVSIGMR